MGGIYAIFGITSGCLATAARDGPEPTTWRVARLSAHGCWRAAARHCHGADVRRRGHAANVQAGRHRLGAVFFLACRRERHAILLATDGDAAFGPSARSGRAVYSRPDGARAAWQGVVLGHAGGQ